MVDGRVDNVEYVRRRSGASDARTIAETVAAAYLTKGEATVADMVGEFALAIVDISKERILGAADALGTRPLYYMRRPGEISLANSVEALLAMPGVQKSPDPDTIVDHLTGRFLSAEKTFFNEIRRVPGGHWTVADEGSLVTKRYWFPPARPAEIRNRAEGLAAFENLFRTSVARRLTARAPILAHVSGGLDSSSIFCVSQDLPGGSKVRGIAAVHPDLRCDESSYISEVAKATRKTIELWNGCESDPIDLTQPGIAAPGSRAVMSGGSTGDMQIAERLRASVVLSGTGGDQLGTPTGVLQDMFRTRSWREAARWTLGFSGVSITERCRRLLFGLTGLVPPSFPRSTIRDRPTPGWLTPSATERARGRQSSSTNLNFMSHVQRRHWEELTSAQLGMAIEYIQRQAAEHAVEVWFPFLDWDLVSFVLSAPSSVWPAPDGRERLHREALARSLPMRLVARRDKAEFSVAYQNRVVKAARIARSMVTGQAWLSEAYVTRQAAVRLMTEVLGTTANPAKAVELWRILTLEAWLRRVFGYAIVRDEGHARSG